jgi:tetratricopeptide (TPR) repeat protein
VLHYAGRLAEAEESLRTAIEKGQIRGGPIQVVALAGLGGILVDRGKFPAAAMALEGSTKLNPRYSGAQMGLAEVMLRQRVEPRRALLLVENAIKLRQSNPRLRKVDRHMLAHMFADRAQALALLGQNDEAIAAIAAASEAGDPEFLPGVAGTLWRCGVAFQLMHRGEEAAGQFRKAIETDPRGRYGKLAAEALTAESVVH